MDGDMVDKRKPWGVTSTLASGVKGFSSVHSSAMSPGVKVTLGRTYTDPSQNASFRRSMGSESENR